MGAINLSAIMHPYNIRECYKCRRKSVRGKYWIVVISVDDTVIDSRNVCADCGDPLYEMQALEELINGTV